MLNRNLIITILILIWQTTVFSQNAETPKNLLSRTVGDADFSVLQERTGSVFLLAEELKDNKKPIAVVRLCSDKPIEVALLKSALHFPAVIENFNVLGFSGKKLLILKSPDCISEIESIAATEIWAIFPNDELPPHTEQYTSDQISIKKIDETIYRYVGHSDYIENALKLIKEMQNDRAAKGVIFGVYNRKPKEINVMLKRVSRLFEQSGIDISRYTIEIMKHDEAMSVNYRNEPPRNTHNYPSFFLVKVADK